MSIDLETRVTRLEDVLQALDGLHDVPPARILMTPTPGTATEDDAIAVLGRGRILCELIDGVLVEKGMGYIESFLGVAIAAMMRAFARAGRLGIVSGSDGPYLLAPEVVLIPDVAFLSWARCPTGSGPIMAVAPDLAVEILSISNTKAEMERKRGLYFDGGTLSVWIVDPERRSIAVYDRDEPETPRVYAENDVIELAEILPGFRLSLAELFGEIDEFQNGPAVS
ncbi:Uma2 family endonuclease [Paludisphaera rhizosphaerae]|uniref:Uma2 family endonuclease n=1 Tax=Paludisphaera rhizosphaerae TaxID=2711216 RepID=UPI0013E9CC4C|nr:Uma2 family endonuclease [Paludisphaera rhizosphaerae]